MRAKIWRASDPHRVSVWHGELEDAGEGRYQVPDSASGFMQANEAYDWIVYEGDLPDSARTLPPDTYAAEDEVSVHTFFLEAWQLHVMVFLGIFFMVIGLANVVANLIRWLF